MGIKTGDPRPVSRVRAAVDIVEAFDVVLAKIISALNFDDPEGDLARVLQSVARAYGNIC